MYPFHTALHNPKYAIDMCSDTRVGCSLMAAKDLVLVQVKISRRAADLLRKRSKRSLRTQASYLRTLIYRDLGLIEVDDQCVT